MCERQALSEARVFVLGRMGRNEDALALMLQQMRDLPGAIEFVQATRRQSPYGPEPSFC